MPLEFIDGLVVGCASGHRFDANKRGYVSLGTASRGIAGDTREILERRQSFLAAGHYNPIAERVVAAMPEGGSLSVVDSGCGTGFYLEYLQRARDVRTALAFDASSAAVAMTVAATGAAGLVGDVWQELPVRSDIADVVLCVFAPRNAREFHRILRPNGTLTIVTPRANHLAQLLARGEVIGIQPDKLAHLDDNVGRHFTLRSRSALEYELTLSAADRRLLASMGPSGHHSLDTTEENDTQTVTVAVDVSTYAPAVPHQVIRRKNA